MDERRDCLSHDFARRAFEPEVSRFCALPELGEAARARALEVERLREKVYHVRGLNQTRFQARARLVVFVKLAILRRMLGARPAHDVVEGRALCGASHVDRT